MMHPLAEARTLKSVLGYRLRTKALIGAAVVTSFASVLSAGSAQAATSTTCANLASDPTITLTTGDKTISNIVCFGDVLGNANAKLDFGLENSIYEFSTNIINGGTGKNTSGGISYTIAINGSNSFDSVALTAAGVNFQAAKKIYSGVNLLATLDVGDEFTFAPNQFFTTLNIVDTWTIASSKFATLQDVNNLFVQRPGRGPGDEVPGPLPILGAAAAFGFSRKLRARIGKSARQAG
jgi:hypothetical protein